ncbi:hypothetical protein WJX72_002278 [[Myrmecia] bisecta]|uniref:ABC1 atypical kinase-like domain-containing protein n=1 Tax=[Myrmecia] bisecta TaxID=41462 RepID=A0AAW1QEK1_9CHLO
MASERVPDHVYVYVYVMGSTGSTRFGAVILSPGFRNIVLVKAADSPWSLPHGDPKGTFEQEQQAAISVATAQTGLADIADRFHKEFIEAEVVPDSGITARLFIATDVQEASLSPAENADEPLKDWLNSHIGLRSSTVPCFPAAYLDALQYRPGCWKGKAPRQILTDWASEHKLPAVCYARHDMVEQATQRTQYIASCILSHTGVQVTPEMWYHTAEEAEENAALFAIIYIEGGFDTASRFVSIAAAGDQPFPNKAKMIGESKQYAREILDRRLRSVQERKTELSTEFNMRKRALEREITKLKQQHKAIAGSGPAADRAVAALLAAEREQNGATMRMVALDVPTTTAQLQPVQVQPVEGSAPPAKKRKVQAIVPPAGNPIQALKQLCDKQRWRQAQYLFSTHRPFCSVVKCAAGSGRFQKARPFGKGIVLPGRASRAVLHEALSSDEIATKAQQNGAGVVHHTANGVSQNGTGNGSGKVLLNGNALVEKVNYSTINGTGQHVAYSSNGATQSGNGNGAARNGNGNGHSAAELDTLAEKAAVRVADRLTNTQNLAVAAPAEDLVLAERRASQNGASAGPSTSSNGSEPARPTATPSTPKTPYVAPGGGRWSNFKKFSVWQRTFQIWSFAITFFFKYWQIGRKGTYGKLGMTEARVSQRKSELAGWLREGLVKLGPTFIKIGQQFSTRVDVLAPEFVKELEKLQDNVPAFDSDAAVAIVEQGIGRPIGEVFESFERTPIAAASLGQVHRARLNGEQVVVKVQRPGLKELFDIDLKNVRVLAQWLQAVDPKSDGAARDWVAIYDECSRILYEEIDYTLEGRNAERFRTNFSAADWLKVPKVNWQYTTAQVLTMEYVPGIKINQVAKLEELGIDRKRLARLAVESYLQQLLTYGFFHADPHPGNISVDPAGGGRLIYYDFGMMGTIPSDVRSGLLELFYGVYQKDPDRCIDALITMGVLVPGSDRTAVRRTAEFFLNSFQERLNAQKEAAARDPGYGNSFKPQATKEDRKAKRKEILANIGEDLLQASADKPFRFPATFTFVVRSFTVLDGIGKGLDPRFDISEIAAPYARDLLLEAKPQFAKLQQDLGKRFANQNRAVQNLFRGPNMIEDVASTMAQLTRGDIKLRVRALEAERALNRVQVMQKVMTNAVVASMLVNMGTMLSLSGKRLASSASWVGAGVFGLMLLVNWLKVKNLERKEAALLAV